MLRFIGFVILLSAGSIAKAADNAYVVLGEDGVQVARVITSDAKCPLIQFDGKRVRMDVRVLPASLPGRADKPSVFPLLTCEKAIPANTRHAMLGHVSLPLLPHEVKRIVVIGDTGCRLKKGDHAYQ